jgi:hypothetical protein
MITTPWTKFFYEYLLEDEQELSVGEMLTVYFGAPSMFITEGDATWPTAIGWADTELTRA